MSDTYRNEGPTQWCGCLLGSNCGCEEHVVMDTPAKRSPDGFVAQRFPESFNNRGHWLVTRMGPGGLEVEVFTDEAVTDWPTLLDERYLEIGS